MPSRSIVVIGSINMDLIARTPRLPRAGETVLGSDFLTVPGGKGANQAVAAARLGGRVYMVGRVGDDDFGRTLLDGLIRNGVDTTCVSRTAGVASGCAMIAVDDASGENAIVVSPGANARLKPADIDAAESMIREAAVVVLQLEIPLKAVRHAVKVCRRLGVPTVLDPAPVPPQGMPADLYRVDVFSPNEHEAKLLKGQPTGRVVLKLGRRGAALQEPKGRKVRIAPFTVKVVDTTGAGDAFTGALAVAIAEGRSWADAVRFANAAGALCCTREGAQPALPTRDAVDHLIAAAGSNPREKTSRAAPAPKGTSQRVKRA